MKTVIKSASLVIIGLLIAHPASAKCDITTLPCWSNGKCNIDFRNKTGEASGADKGTSLDQTSAAQTIKVKAVQSDGDTAGNKLSITAGAKNTMNMENKYDKNFETVRVSSTNGITSGVSLSCSVVKKVLAGSGSCKIFHGEKAGSSNTFYLGYSCDGSSLVGPLN